MRVAVVGGGWAGLGAAVLAHERGHAVEVFEMASRPGGRARTVERDGWRLDNGQHILVGAYSRCLALMRRVGVEPDRLLMRRPLSLTLPDGRGLKLAPGAPSLAFARAAWRHPAWRWHEAAALLLRAASWRLRGFRCDPSLDVGRLCAGLPAPVMRELVEPLCVAALNTPASRASAAVFLRVLRDALFAGPGAADLLLPRVPMGDLLPAPATAWLQARGVPVHLGLRVPRLARHGREWQVGERSFDAVVLAAGPRESARLARDIAPDWARTADALEHLPIATVWLLSPGTRLIEPMHQLAADDRAAPAQFVFDLGQLDQPAGDGGSAHRPRDGLLAFVVSGADRWAAEGLDATSTAILGQARRALGARLNAGAHVVHAAIERRATFACTPGLARPPTRIAEGLVAAGDHVDGPYPATLEGAVRSAEAAVDALSPFHIA